jgi:hypothetical protein
MDSRLVDRRGQNDDKRRDVSNPRDKARVTYLQIA